MVELARELDSDRLRRREVVDFFLASIWLMLLPCSKYSLGQPPASFLPPVIDWINIPCADVACSLQTRCVLNRGATFGVVLEYVWLRVDLQLLVTVSDFDV